MGKVRQARPVPLLPMAGTCGFLVALGVLTGDAIVIAADSELSVSDYMSVAYNKIRTVVRARDNTGDAGILVMTGAGGEAYLEALFQDIQDRFVGPDPLSLDAFGQA